MRKHFLRQLAFIFILSATGIGQEAERPQERISVPDINGMAISLVKPAFPETAVAASADGAGVSLKVVVDENGNVISAQCSLKCHPMLKDAAELAAATSKFRPLVRGGRAVKYEGILLYTFVVDRVDWFRFGTALESTRQFDNISLGPVAQMLPMRLAEEKAKLLLLDQQGVELETRWRVIREVETSLKGKLQGKELWAFEIAMGLRRITFWTNASERTDRAQLQKSIDDLARLIAAAPEGTPEPLLAALMTVSKYRVSIEIAEGDLRQAIFTMTYRIRLEQ
jgi:hypothetical protein